MGHAASQYPRLTALPHAPRPSLLLPSVCGSGPHHLESVEEYRKLYEQSISDPKAFWGNLAKEFHWHEPWDDDHLEFNFDARQGRVSTSFFRGGKTNICYNALDRHVLAGDGDR